MNDLDLVFSPLKVGGHNSRNRIVCSPISINLADRDGAVNDEIINFYTAMGDTGVGIVTIGATAVSHEGGATANGMHIGPPRLNSGLTKLAKSVKKTGALVSLQIFHVGAQGNTRYSGSTVVGPSSYTCPDIGIEARELRVGEIEEIENDFANAVKTGLDCGFDLVEIHISHGYLLHNFLAPFFNRRSDEYGGSKENRIKIFSNIVSKIKISDANSLHLVGARISGNDFIKGGMSIEGNLELIELLEENNLAYWVVSAGIYETASEKYIKMKNGAYYEYAAQLKEHANAPVVAQGGIWNLRSGGKVLSSGQSDLFGMGRALIADPDLIKKTQYGQEDKIIPCIGGIHPSKCNRCRYIKRKDLIFDCVRPNGYHPDSSRWTLELPHNIKQKA